jgi:hypothetical protein
MPTEVGGHMAPTPAVHGHDGYRAHTIGSDAYEEGEASISEGPNVVLLRSRQLDCFQDCLRANRQPVMAGPCTTTMNLRIVSTAR